VAAVAEAWAEEGVPPEPELEATPWVAGTEAAAEEGSAGAGEADPNLRRLSTQSATCQLGN
jgi:hypothetical protein